VTIVSSAEMTAIYSFRSENGRLSGSVLTTACEVTRDGADLGRGGDIGGLGKFWVSTGGSRLTRVQRTPRSIAHIWDMKPSLTTMTTVRRGRRFSTDSGVRGFAT